MQNQENQKQLEKLKSIQKKYNITEQMLLEADKEASPSRMLQGMKPKKK